MSIINLYKPKAIIRTFLLCSVLVFFSLNVLSAKEVTYDYFINAGLSGNWNLYKSNFKQIPGYDNCCNDFTSASGLGYNLFGGFEFILKKEFLGGELRANLNLAYRNLSATYAVDEYIGHIIQGNSYTNGISEHWLDAKIDALGFEPTVIYYPTKLIPVSIFGGFDLSLPLSMNFSQEERLLNPANGTFENLSRTRNVYNGKIPKPSSVLFGLELGVRYELLRFGDLILIPQIQFNYGMSNMAQSLDWKVNSLNFGLALQYAIPNYAIEPLPPPPPIMPNAPSPEEISLTLDIKYNGRNIKSGDTIFIPVSETRYINNFSVIPIIFFSKNSSDFEVSDKSPSNNEEAQKYALTYIASYLKNNPDVNVTLTSSYLDDEDNDISKTRLDAVIKMLKAEGIEDSRISSKIISFSASDFKEEMLKNENRYIKAEFSNQAKILFSNNERTTEQANNVVLNIKPNIQPQSKETSYKGTLSLSNRQIENLNLSMQDYSISSKEFLNDNATEEIKIEAEASNPVYGIASYKSMIYLNKKTDSVINYENLLSKNNDTASVKQFILGFCEFDKSNFYCINENVIKLIKEEADKGNTIELYALTDNLGEEEYNHNLAQKRANSALTLLGAYKNKVTVKIPETYMFSNDSPSSILFNRTVLIRIIGKSNH